MSSAVAESPRVSTFWIALLPVLACFALAVWQMHHDWTYDETYRYGWVVPPLLAYLISVRWRDRPEPNPVPTAQRKLTGWILLAVLWPLVWILREANPDWRLIGLTVSGLAIAAGLLWWRELGGTNWQRHFAGVTLFFAISIPWPSVLEKGVSSILMPANAAIALEALHWMGVPSIRRGNLITLAEGTLGVEEACSGVRSLQATLMMAVFLGELNYLRWPQRLALVLGGVGIALLTNAGRTIALSAAAAESGLALARKWHDSAGMIVLGINAVLMLILGAILTKRSDSGRRRRAAATTGSEPRSFSLRFSRGPLALGVALVLMIPLVAFWYGRRESPIGPMWELNQPVADPSFRSVRINDLTAKMLRYSRGWSAKWSCPNGHPLHGFFIEWQPGKMPPENMNVHRPGGCLANLGMEEIGELAPLEVKSNGQILPIRFLQFRDGKRPLYIAYFVVELQRNQKSEVVGAFDFSYGRRFAAALAGRRNAGQRLLEIGTWDQPNEAQARAVLTDYLEKHLVWK
jgi:exosortase